MTKKQARARQDLGKWKMSYAMDLKITSQAHANMVFLKAASINDLKPGMMMKVKIENKEICLVNVNGNFYAIGDRCTHANCSLSGGTLNGMNVECPCHLSVFNLKTGAVVKGPAREPELIYQVKIEGGQILVNV